MNKTVQRRQKIEKEKILEKLKITPIVQIACEKAGVGRATYYRWRKSDPEFRKKSDEAIEKGSLMVNDMAESQLLSAIRDRNLTAIIFWLKHHHSAYATRIEVTAKLKKDEKLTEEQEKLIDKALLVAKLIPNKKEK